MNYADFLSKKTQLGGMHGFEPLWLQDRMMDFQGSLATWAIRRGRAAILAGCGLGKTLIQLVWGENVVRHTNKPVLVLAPLGVTWQTVKEAQAFGMDCKRSVEGKKPFGARMIVTNYERLKCFSPDDFSGVVCDESGCLKDCKSVRKDDITEFMRPLKYRLLCTATPAPNDFVELGNSAEALGEMGFRDMVTMFFKKKFVSDFRGWSREKFELKGHAHQGFWRWVCSWARACRKPSDLGFNDTKFVLPELRQTEHVIVARTKRSGDLFEMPAVTLEDQREERRRTLSERCAKVAELVTHTGKPALVWCHLNDEGKLLQRMIPGSVEVSGADRDEKKEEKLLAFISGQVRVLVTKPQLAGWGLNLQHCSHMTFFPSHSFESTYQAIRRCWRFGQTQPVQVDMVTSEGERGVLANLKNKEAAAEIMMNELVRLMGDQLLIERSNPFTQQAEAPRWLS
jgi:hypothetical protein